MYTISLLLLIVLAILAIAWSPIFALIAGGLLFVLFLAYVGMRPRAAQKINPPADSAGKYEDNSP